MNSKTLPSYLKPYFFIIEQQNQKESASSSSSSMAKQTVVLRLSMDNAKKLRKAKQCAAGFPGVRSVSFEGDKMTVAGEGIYSVELTMLLRNKMRNHVDLFGVTTAVEKNKEADKDKDKEKEKEKKRTVVIKLSMEDANKRAKAMLCAAGLRGVRSVLLDEDTMTVEGVWIDSEKLTWWLRKKMNDHVDLFRVTTAVEKAKKEADKKKEKEKEERTMVIKLSMEDDDKCTKAMQCAARLRGVHSMWLAGDTMTVKGEGIDSVKLTTLLRTNMSGHIDLFGVTTAVAKAKEKEADKEERTVVINLSMEDDDKRAIAMQCAARLRGVRSVLLDEDTMTVEGVWIDSVDLTRRLRKKMSDHVDLFGVTTTVEKAKEKKADKEKEKEERTVVINLSMEDDDKRSKAMQCAAMLRGVHSMSLEGDTMTVKGEGIDSVELTTLLRTKMSGHVDLFGVTTAVEKKISNDQPLSFPNNYGRPYIYNVVVTAFLLLLILLRWFDPLSSNLYLLTGCLFLALALI